MKQAIIRLITVGSMLVLSACANAIDIICRPAGQYPDVRSWHGGGY